MKKMAASVKEAAERFIREAYQVLSAKGKPYIDKFIKEDIRADLVAEAQAKEKPQAPQADETEYQVIYQPKSKGNIITETLTPRYMQEAITKSLNALEEEVGDIDAYVADKLQYDSLADLHRALSADQVDAAALAIKNIDAGQGMIIGDQTGVGKGRVAAAMIRYAQIKGKKPIFFTEKANLYTDIYRDIVDIGHTVNPYMFNADGIIYDKAGRQVFSALKGRPRSNMLGNIRSDGIDALGEYDCIFTTYSQINTHNIQQGALLRAAAGNIVIMDESHNASGQSNTGAFLRDMLEHAEGVLYLSATFAKRPDNMPIYYRTSMSQTNLSMQELVAAIDAGGMPLQEIVAHDLASIGQYIRRELSFAGIKNEYVTDSVNKGRDERISDQMTDALRDIITIDGMVGGFIEGMLDDVKDDGGSLGGVNVRPGYRVPGRQRPVTASVSTATFASTVHNAVRALLLSMKSDAAVDAAVTELKAGNKVVISLANTMGSFVEDQMEMGNLSVGDTFDMTFADVLKRYLRRVLQFTVVQPNGDREKGEISPEELAPEILEEYRRLERKIDQIVTHLPGSPLDYIKAGIMQEGFTIDELTGRKYVADLEDPDNPVLRQRGGDEIKNKAKTVAAFNRGSIDALIINQAGSTGISLHAHPESDRKPRVNIIVQSELEINTEVQKMGRINRKGQVELPRYKTLLLDIPAEIRPATVMMKKLSSLSANTSANADSPLAQQQFPDMINRYGDRVVNDWLGRLTGPELHSLRLDRGDSFMKTSGKMALQPVAYQRRFFGEIEDEYNALIEDLKEDGAYDLEVGDVELAAKTIDKRVVTAGTDENHPFGRSTYMEQLETKNLKKPYKKSAIDRRVADVLDGKTADEYGQDFYSRIRSEAEQFVADNREGLTDEAFARLQDWTRNNLDALKYELVDSRRSKFVPGRMFGMRGVAGQTDVAMNGIVLDMKLAKGGGNPANGSRIRITFAMNNNMQKYTVPLSKIRSGKIRVWPRDSWVVDNWDDYLEDIDTTTRFVITGNVLQGFANAPAGSRVIRFTMEDGSRRNGILTPLNFTTQASAELVRVTADQAVQIGTSKTRLLGSVVEIKPFRGQFQIAVPRTRQRGGPYFLDGELRRLTVTGDFETIGNEMRAQVEPGNIEAVIRRVYALGETFTVPRSDYDRISGGQGETRAAMGSAPGTDVRRRQLTPGDVKRVQKIIPMVQKAMADAGLADNVIKKVNLELKPIIDLRGKDVQKTLDEWAKEGKQASAILGATTFKRMNALMELSLEQDLNRLNRTTYHESFHVVAKWVLPKTEYDRVMRHYRTEESAAEAFADFVAGRQSERRSKPIGTLRRIFLKLKRFLQKLGNALRGQGFSRAEDVFEKVVAKQYRPHFGKGHAPYTTTALEAEKWAPVWYSQMQRVLDKKLPGKGTADQMLSTIRALANKGEFKTEELEWSGLEDWLEDKRYKITSPDKSSIVVNKSTDKIGKGEIIAFLEAHNVQVKDVLKGEPQKYPTGEKELSEEMRWPHEGEPVNPDYDYIDALIAERKEEFYLAEVTDEYRENYGDDAAEEYADEIDQEATQRAETDVWETFEQFEQEYRYIEQTIGYQIYTTAVADYYNLTDENDRFIDQFTSFSDAEDAATEHATERFGQPVYDEGYPMEDLDESEYLEEHLPGYGLMTAPGGGWVVLNADEEDITAAHTDPWDAVSEALIAEGLDDMVPLSRTQHEKYVVDGGENYRELVLTWGNRNKIGQGWSAADYDRVQDLAAKIRGDFGDQPTEAERQEYQLLIERQQAFNRSNKSYQSSHWSEKDVLAHVRFNTRVNDKGEKVLFIEEIQSDWHQAGRKRGYDTPENKEKIAELIQQREKLGIEANEILKAYQRPGDNYEQAMFRMPSDKATRYESLIASYNALREQISALEMAVPRAPYEKTWPLMAIKRMVRYAAERGFDRIAWTPGVMQVERYQTELRQRVDKIVTVRRGENVEVTAFKYGSTNGERRRVFDEVMPLHGFKEIQYRKVELDDLIGKEMAEKARTSENSRNVFEGEDLTIGGEGMKGFYDKILVAEFNKFFGKKAWGKAKVEPSTIQSQGEPYFDIYGENQGGAIEFEAWSIPITREMRDRALGEGMTLFRLGDLRERMRGFIAGSRDNDRASVLDDVFPEPVRGRWKEAAKGLTRASVWQRLKDTFAEAVATMTPGRMFPKLTNKHFGRANEILRNVLEVPAYSKWAAAEKVKEILAPESLSPEDYELFSAQIILDDFLKDMDEGGVLENWEDIVAEQGELAFGFQSRAEVEETLERLGEKVRGNERVQQALARRERYMTALRRQLVEAKLLKPEVLGDPRYFHHQVLEYANAKYGTGTGSRDVRVHKKGYQIHRIGSVKDYNAHYVQAEFEVIAQGISQLEMKKNLDEIKREYNIMGELRSKAKRDNYIAVVGGLDNFNRLQELRAMKAELQSMETGRYSNETKQRLKRINDEIWDLDPTMPMRVKIARGFAHLGLTLDEDVDLIEPGDVDWLRISELADQGDVNAAMILKGITERNAMIKETLGRGYVTWQKLMAERAPLEGSAGWASWKPKPGTAWYMTNSINDRILEQVLEGNRELADPDVRKVLARGVDVQWVLPSELAEVLDGQDFINLAKDNIVSRAAENTLNWWKRWILINPARIIKYNLNNLSGDLDISLAYNPKILKHAKAAATDLWAMHYNKEMGAELKAEIDLAVRNGVIGSGMTVHDIPDIGSAPQMKKLMEALSADKRSALRYIERFWEGSKNFTTWRENVLRLAAYRFFRERLRAGERLYGASDPGKVDAAEGIERKAALLARELIGDYGGLSKGGQWLRRKMIPFYSWLEINAPRYYRMFKNLAVEGEPLRGRGLRTGAVLGKKAAFLTAKMSMLYAAVSLFNHLFWPDEEEELGEVGRRQLHLILGRRADGTIITTRFQGALSDALSWFNLHDFPEDMRELATGKKTVYQWVGEAPLEMVNKLVQGVRPDLKTPAEMATGRQVYPEFWRPRPIRDKWEHAARLFSAEAIYRRVAGKPIRGDSVGQRVLNDLAALFTYSADPGEAAYFDTRKMVGEFLESNNLEKPLADPTNRSNALYYYKQAIKFGDAQAAEKYLAKYKGLGGKMKYLRVSIDRAHPLASLPGRFRSNFFNRLSAEDRQTIKRATEWYNRTYKGKTNANVALSN